MDADTYVNETNLDSGGRPIPDPESHNKSGYVRPEKLMG